MSVDPLVFGASWLNSHVPHFLERLDAWLATRLGDGIPGRFVRLLPVWNYLVRVFRPIPGDIPQLNGLRALAILFIFLVHLYHPLH